MDGELVHDDDEFVGVRVADVDELPEAADGVAAGSPPADENRASAPRRFRNEYEVSHLAKQPPNLGVTGNDTANLNDSGTGEQLAGRAVAAYTEWPAHPGLAHYVVCTWANPTPRSPHPVLPDACIDIVWDGAQLLLAGPDTGPAEIAPGASFVGIRFRPGAAPAVLGVPASEVRDRRVPLAAFWGREADEIADRLACGEEGTARLLEKVILARLPAAAPVDPLVEWVVRELVRSQTDGHVVRALARRLATDERTLHRRCLAALGYGPKTLDRILRFRRALRLGQEGLPAAAVAAAAGYADQAHLSRECRRLAGATPRALFADPAAIVSSNI